MYTNKNGEDIIIIKKNNIKIEKTLINLQNLIFVGVINFNQAQFDINHILKYKDPKIFSKEQNIFLK